MTAAATHGRIAYSVSEVAELLGLSEKTVYRRIADGGIAATKIGTLWLIPSSWLEQFSASTSSAPLGTPPAPVEDVDAEHESAA